MQNSANAECCGKSLEFVLAEGTPLQTVPETATCKSCNTYYEKIVGSKVSHKETKDGFECTGCGKPTRLAVVKHFIHDGPWPRSGLGRMVAEEVRYCPNCEELPKGKPIQISPDISYML